MIPAASPESLPVPPLALEVNKCHDDVIEDVHGFWWYEERRGLPAND